MNQDFSKISTWSPKWGKNQSWDSLDRYTSNTKKKEFSFSEKKHSDTESGNVVDIDQAEYGMPEYPLTTKWEGKVENMENMCEIGDIKQTIDDLKASLLSYYSNLYSLSGLDIDEKLDILCCNKGYLGSASQKQSNMLRISHVAEENPTQLERKGSKNYDPVGDWEYCGNKTSRKQSYSADYEEAQNITREQSSLSATTPKEGTRELYEELRKRENSISKVHDDHISKMINRGTTNYQENIKDQNRGMIEELLQDLEHKCKSISIRLNTVADDLDEEIGNPNLKEHQFYCYIPDIRRRTAFGSRENLKKYIMTTFANLHNQVEFNKRKIASLQTKMKILNIHTSTDSQKFENDPRLAF